MRKFINELVWFGDKEEADRALETYHDTGHFVSEMYFYKNEIKCGKFEPIVGDDQSYLPRSRTLNIEITVNYCPGF